MNTKKSINYMSVAAIFFGFAVFANDVSAAQENKAEKVLENISKEGRTAMQELRLARVAIFNGQLKQAKDMLDRSKKELSTVEKQAPELVVTIKTEEKAEGKTVSNEKAAISSDLIPIDAGLVVAEDFVATPEKSEKIKKANEHLKNNETSKAIGVLREAGIGLSISRVLMPVKETLKHVDKAIEQFGEHKYYEANLALKAAEDGLIVDSVLLYEPVPAPKKEPVAAPEK
jgi:hypothetical protein